jgi:hypothetical protein
MDDASSLVRPAALTVGTVTDGNIDAKQGMRRTPVI